MAKGYLDLMKKARDLAEKDIHRIVGDLQGYAQHFPDAVAKALGIFTHKGGANKAVAATAAPVAASAAAPATKTRKGGRRLTKEKMAELRGLVKSSLKGKVKQVEFIKKFVADHPGYKPATIQQIIWEFRDAEAIKTQEIVKGKPKEGLYLIAGK